MKTLNKKDLENMLEKDLKNVNENNFFKALIIEQLLQREENVTVTKEQLENAVSNLMDNDMMWSEIDNAIADTIQDFE